jgi:hypothetical protein
MIALEGIMVWIHRAVLRCAKLQRAVLHGAILPGATSRRLLLLLPAGALFLFIASCNGFFVSESSIQSVTVQPSAVILAVGTATAAGDSYTLSSTSTTVGGTTATDTTTAAWSSSKTTVATVGNGTTNGGVVSIPIGSTAGGVTATITAKDGGQSGSCIVYTYSGIAPTALTLTYPSSINPNLVSPGTPLFQVTATANINGNPAQNISPYVTWQSSDTSTATVDVNGNVTVLATATISTSFTITATATFASGSVAGTQIFTIN